MTISSGADNLSRVNGPPSRSTRVELVQNVNVNDSVDASRLPLCSIVKSKYEAVVYEGGTPEEIVTTLKGANVGQLYAREWPLRLFSSFDDGCKRFRLVDCQLCHNLAV